MAPILLEYEGILLSPLDNHVGGLPNVEPQTFARGRRRAHAGCGRMPARNDDVDDFDPAAVVGLELVDEPIAACIVFVVLDGAIVAFVFIVVEHPAVIAVLIELRRFRNAERVIVIVVRHHLVVVGCDGQRPEV